MSDEIKVEEVKPAVPVPGEGSDVDATGIDNLNTLADNPFWLPAGSFRSLFTLLVILCSLGLFWSSGKIPGELNTLLGIVIGFYFSASRK